MLGKNGSHWLTKAFICYDSLGVDDCAATVASNLTIANVSSP